MGNHQIIEKESDDAINLGMLTQKLNQNRRQKVFIRRALRLCRWAWHLKIWQKLHWFIVFYISIFGGLEFCLGELSPPKPPLWWRDWVDHYINEANNLPTFNAGCFSKFKSVSNHQWQTKFLVHSNALKSSGCRKLHIFEIALMRKHNVFL